IQPQLAVPPDDDKIHLLYAGIIDTHKAGAFNALRAAEYLSEKYVLHIIGFGAVELLQKEIEKINSLKKCRVVYDGLLNGDDYIKYCQQCHIGLSTQNVEGEYLESSFPSKILSYLGMGLNVISGEIACVKQSSVSDIVRYYAKNNPREISEVIKKSEIINRKEIINRLTNLNEAFVKKLQEEIFK